MSKKVIKIETEQGRVFEVDLTEVAEDKANYYSHEGDFEGEYAEIMKGKYSAIDWFQNNMNFWECKTLKECYVQKVDLDELDISDCYVFEKQENKE